MLSSTLLSLATLALAGSTQAALHNTRSRQHSADLAARRVGPIAPREVVEANRTKSSKKRAEKKKRCGKHQGGGGSSTSSASGVTPTGSSSGSGSGSSSSGSGGTGGVSGLTHVSLPSSGFQGTQTGGIMSWFQADSSQDSTNGVSWCNIHYDNSMPLFAPDMKVLSPTLATWGSDAAQWEKDATTWCGLEALVTYKGKTVPMYIGDAFDPQWVRTPASIDVLVNTFAEIFGENPNGDKDIVGEGVSWKLTGYKNPAYAFKN